MYASIQRKYELFPGVRESHQQDVIALSVHDEHVLK